MFERYQMVIDGERRTAASGQWLPVLDPSTGHTMAEAPAGTDADVRTAVSVALREFEEGDWPRYSAGQRSRVLHRLADIVEERSSDIAELEARNNGRPIRETHAQIMMLPEFFRYNASLAVTFRGDTVPIGDGYLEYLHYSPIGVVGVMAPFNHPLLIAVRGIAPALAAGNTIVVKPSELTPLTTFLLAELALEAGLPPGVLNVVNGLGSSAGAALSSHANIARMEFTGGTETGRKVATEAAARLGSVTAELGGKTPVLVFNDADLDSAASGAAFAGFIAAGQSCVAGSRVIVQEAVADQFKERLVDVTEGIRVGDPLDTGTQMGPVISQAAKNRIVEAIDCAKSEGCEVLAGGSQPEVSPQLAAGFWVRPTVLAIKGEPAVTRTELFGPVISIETFGDEDEAVRIANNSDYGLGAAVWTKDVAKAHRVAQQIQSGMIWVNDHHRLSPAMPWGGMKQSGIGKQAGEESFRGFLEERSIIVRTAVGGPEWFADSGEERLN